MFFPQHHTSPREPPQILTCASQVKDEMDQESAAKVDRWDKHEQDSAPTPQHLKQEKYANAFADAVEEMLDERLGAFAQNLQDLDRGQKSLEDAMEEMIKKRFDSCVIDIEQKHQQLIRRVDGFEALLEKQQVLTSRVEKLESITDVIGEHGLRMDKLSQEIKQITEDLGCRQKSLEDAMEGMVGKHFDSCIIDIEQKQQQLIRRVDSFQSIEKRIDGFGALLEKQQMLTSRVEKLESITDVIGEHGLRMDKLPQEIANLVEDFDRRQTSLEYAVEFMVEKQLDGHLKKIEQKQQQLIRRVDSFQSIEKRVDGFETVVEKQQMLTRRVYNLESITDVIGEHGLRMDKLSQEIKQITEDLGCRQKSLEDAMEGMVGKRFDSCVIDIEQKQQQLIRRVDSFQSIEKRIDGFGALLEKQQRLTGRVEKLESITDVIGEHGLRMHKLSQAIASLGEDFDRRQTSLEDAMEGMGEKHFDTILIETLLNEIEQKQQQLIRCVDSFHSIEKRVDSFESVVKKQQRLTGRVDKLECITDVVGEHEALMDKLSQVINKLEDRQTEFVDVAEELVDERWDIFVQCLQVLLQIYRLFRGAPSLTC